MTEQVNPSLGRGAGPFETAGAFAFGAHGDGGWISPPNDPTDISVQSERIDESYLYSFNESHSSTSFTVDVEGGEAFAFGAWMAKDTTTGVYIGSNANETIYAGWDKNKGNSVIIGTASDFASTADDTDKKIPLWQAKSDGTGVYTVDDLRQIDQAVSALRKTANVTNDYTTSGENLVHTDTSNNPITVTLSTEDAQKGKEIIVSDIEGAILQNSVTVNTEGTESIDGGSSIKINRNYGSVTFRYDGSEWVTGNEGLGNKSFERGAVGQRVFTANPDEGGEVSVAVSGDAHVEERSGSFDTDGVPSVKRGDHYDDILPPNGKAEVYMWNPGASVAGGFPSAASSPKGMEYTGSSYWVADSTSNYIYQHDTSGSVVGGFRSPSGATPRGIAKDGSNFLISTITPTYIYETDTSGNITGGFKSPNSNPRHLAWNGADGDLWHADNNSESIFRLDRNGNVKDEFSAPGGTAIGIADDGVNLWHVSHSSQYVYELDKSGGILGGFNTPAPGSHGVEFDGGNILVSTGSNYIYKLSDSYDYSAGVIN